MVIVALFPVGKMWKQSKCSLVDKQVNIMYILYIFIYHIYIYIIYIIIYIYIYHIHMHTMECFEALK